MADKLPPHKMPLDTVLHIPPSQQSAQYPVPKPGEPVRPEVVEPEPKPEPKTEPNKTESKPKLVAKD